MKFKTIEDVQLFLMEINRIDLLNSVKEDFIPTDEQIKSFIKSRKSMIPGLKDFRRSQSSKANWRKNRYSMMKGLKNYHKSTAGKKHHRALGRYLATRDFKLRSDKPESYSPLIINEICEVLKGLSSLRTHLFIEFEYFHSVNEQVDMEIVLDEVLPMISRVENNIFTNSLIEEDDLELLLRLVEKKVLIAEFSEFYKKDTKELESLFEKFYKGVDNISDESHLTIFNNIKTELLILR
jgi:hypothetical protein